MSVETVLWITNPEYQSPASLHEMSEEQLGRAVFVSKTDMSDSGWVKVGTATMEMKLFSRDEMVGGAIEAIKQQIQNTKAEAEAKVTMLTGKLNDLLMIPMAKADE